MSGLCSPVRLLALLLLVPYLASADFSAVSSAQTASGVSAGDGILPASEVATLMPPSVFFEGQTAPVQMRNAAGVRFAGGGLLLAGLVDTSGYASSVQQRYQGYLLLDTPVAMEGHQLSPGAYGFGFVGGEQFLLMDLSGHTLFTLTDVRDALLARPSPLRIALGAGSSGVFRLYAGRSFVSFAATPSRP